ncbi:response regulator [Candidiatus Paracoxiella cheracis]|uniref:response regulator n=1 Tax=Candidiatus Paracoxiella cheracis TaxID=3405120 RepID=UPI003BF4823A
MQVQKSHILIVDDDPQIGDLLSEYLEQHGYRVSVARNGHEMKRVMKRAQFALVVLDIMLPGEDGLALCRFLRETSEIPIIMLSAVGEEADRVVGLEVGADDYLAKPFSPRELLARIKALARRTTGTLADKRKARQVAKMPNIYFKDWTLDQNKRRLIAPDGVAVPLSAGEYELLVAFLENPQRTLNRDQLLDLTHGREATPFDRTIDVQVARLRKKIETDPKNPQIIVTMRGDGYQFNAEVTTD